MNMILFVVVVALGLKTAYDYKDLYFSIPIYKFSSFSKKKKRREFKTFKVIETNHKTMWYEENHMICNKTA